MMETGSQQTFYTLEMSTPFPAAHLFLAGQ